jgi:dienelactone hydrolase
VTARPPAVAAGARRSRFVLGVWALGLVLGGLAFAPLRRTVGAVTLLQELGTKGAPRPDVVTSDFVVREGGVRFRARLYVAPGTSHGCAVVGHGVHWKGIDEPRMTAFASRIAARGIVVMTPELAELADYRITEQGRDVLAASVRHLSARCGGIRVGLIGFSFAGGLGLLAAEQPDVSAHLSYVNSVGGYDDLSRVLRYLLTDRVETPSGVVSRKAHEYGLIVLLYEHLDAFVPEEDLPTMNSAVREWLMENRTAAWAFASLSTTEASEKLFLDIVHGHRERFREALAPILKEKIAAARLLSPSGHLDRIPVPVYLLHGEGDAVIPPEETLWADRELGAHSHRALVTPLIEHVEISGKPTLGDQWALVHFMSSLL